MYIQYKICICNIMIYQYTIDKYIQIYLYDAPPVVETRCGLGSAVIGPRVKFLLIYVYMYVCISVCIYPSIHLSIYPSIHLSIYPSIHLSIYQSIYLSMYVWMDGWMDGWMYKYQVAKGACNSTRGLSSLSLQTTFQHQVGIVSLPGPLRGSPKTERFSMCCN